MLRFGEREIEKETFYSSKKPTNIWYVNINKIVISKLVKTKANSKYLIGIKIDKAIRALILILPKISGYVQTLDVKAVKKGS